MLKSDKTPAYVTVKEEGFVNLVSPVAVLAGGRVACASLPEVGSGELSQIVFLEVFVTLNISVEVI